MHPTIRMTNRQTSRIAFAYAVATAVPVTGIVLFSLIADWSRSQTLLLLIGSLLVVWAILFSFLEVGAIAARSKNLTKQDEGVDPDAPRRVMVAPPTGEPYPPRGKRGTGSRPAHLPASRSYAIHRQPAARRPSEKACGLMVSARLHPSRAAHRWRETTLRRLRPLRLRGLPPAPWNRAFCPFPAWVDPVWP
jgi:hypothetical protein